MRENKEFNQTIREAYAALVMHGDDRKASEILSDQMRSTGTLMDSEYKEIEQIFELLQDPDDDILNEKRAEWLMEKIIKQISRDERKVRATYLDGKGAINGG